ncbi:hypothetical protein GN278_15130 [Rhodobacteraceae bacterium Araon29]
MENEMSLFLSLISEGFRVIALTLALMAPLGLAVAAMGSGRFRNRFSNLGWMILQFPYVFVLVYLIGWMFSFAFSAGPGFTGGFQSAWHAVPWADFLGPGFHQTETGTYRLENQDFIRFAVLGWFGSVIVAGSILERIKLGGLLLLTTVLVGFFLPVAVGWGWSENGWMVVLMGYHDPTGIVTTATLCGGFALGVLRVLGPRIGSWNDKGQIIAIAPHSFGMVLTGHLLFFLGLVGFSLAGLNLISPVQLGEITELLSTTIYGAPADPAGMFVNLLAAITGGLLIGTILTNADICKTVTLALAGLVGTLPVIDFFNPLLTLGFAMFLTWACRNAREWLERKFCLDDVTGSVAFFGFSGFWGLVVSGFLLWGSPVTIDPETVHINPFGNTTAAMILFWVLGFIPGYISARVLSFAEGLRLDQTTELAGRDLTYLREAEESATSAYELEDQFIRENL